MSTGDTITISGAPSVKNVSDSKENSFTYVLTNADQYETVTTENGTLTITKAPLKITADSATKEYDGSPLTDDGWNDTAPEGLKGTDAITSVTVTGSQTEVGSSDNVASAAVVKNGDVDVTANYEITYVKGTLEVTKSTAAIKIVSDSKSWEYDGESHDYVKYTVTYGDQTLEGTEGRQSSR